ncbi:hypothetical protein M8J75_007143 [Diaphorina citri]|nr:hypothetical protein M8J75_001059 [Diaphorina citri]KAI5707020.1 hypothetical protein M8J75_013512 [Diaphorina citri]KAI5712277.1 hypothetical protein M8J75_007143 [Diaphorina citri]
MAEDRVRQLEKRVKGAMSDFAESLERVKDMVVLPGAVPGTPDPANIAVHKCLQVLQVAFDMFQMSICEELNQLKSDLGRLEERQDNLESYSRRTCLLVFGVPEPESVEREEDCELAALDIFNRKLKLMIQPTDIDRSHRLGSRRQGKCRPIIVKFCSYKTRAAVFSSKAKLKGSNIRIGESLTRTRLAILNAARDRFGVRSCWTADGKILIQVPSSDGTSRRHVVTTKRMLDAIKDPAPPGPSQRIRIPDTSSTPPASGSSRKPAEPPLARPKSARQANKSQ